MLARTQTVVCIQQILDGHVFLGTVGRLASDLTTGIASGAAAAVLDAARLAAGLGSGRTAAAARAATMLHDVVGLLEAATFVQALAKVLPAGVPCPARNTRCNAWG